MTETLTNTTIKDFLKDYLENSNTSLLEEGKEKDDILEVAEARGYNLKGNTDLAGFKTIFTFADKANKNRARLPKEKLIKALPGIIGKPVDIDHIRQYVVGHYIDFRYKAAEDMVIAYGVFYKSNFGDEWETAQKLFKAGKLGTSYEIWCPKNKRKNLPDGTYELQEMEIAGGGLMFKEKPAFEDAKVLEVAKIKSQENEPDLVIASTNKYSDEELIVANEIVSLAVKDKQGNIIGKTFVTPDVSIQQPTSTVVAKLVCKNCNKEFDNTGITAQQSEKKCPHCFAIVDENGEVKYPPQVTDFKVNCPSCGAFNWRIDKRTEDGVELSCLGCKKEFAAEFKKSPESELLNEMSFLVLGTVICPQCGMSIPYNATSKIDSVKLHCNKCGMDFSKDIAKQEKKKIVSKIVEKAALSMAAAEGGEMSKENESIEQAVAPQAANPVAVPPVEQEPNTPVVEQPTEVVPVITESEKPVVPELPQSVVTAEACYEVEDADMVEASESDMEEAKLLTPEQRNTLKDEDFAVVKEVKNKKTGEMRKIRMYPLNDEAHVRNALARINQAAGKKGLEMLGVSIEETKKKIEDKAKSLGIEVAEVEKPEKEEPKCSACGNKKTLLKKAAKKIRELKKANKMVKASEDVVANLKNEQELLIAKINLLEANAVKIIERKNMLCEYANSLSEKDILDDDKFEMARVKKENAELKSKLETASTHVSVKANGRSDDELREMAQAIDAKAFGRKV